MFCLLTKVIFTGFVHFFLFFVCFLFCFTQLFWKIWTVQTTLFKITGKSQRHTIHDPVTHESVKSFTNIYRNLLQEYVHFFGGCSLFANKTGSVHKQEICTINIIPVLSLFSLLEIARWCQKCIVCREKTCLCLGLDGISFLYANVNELMVIGEDPKV